MILRFLSRLVDIVSWAVSTVILIRFLMKFLGAGTTAPFVIWLYNFTDTLMVPFHGIFPAPNLAGNAILDIPALVAALIYAGAGYLVSTLVLSLAEHLKAAGSKEDTVTNPPQDNLQSLR